MKRSKIVNGVEFENISGYGNYPYYNPKTQSTFTKPNKYNYFVENWKRIWKWWDEIPSRRPDDYIFISSSYVGGIITIVELSMDLSGQDKIKKYGIFLVI